MMNVGLACGQKPGYEKYGLRPKDSVTSKKRNRTRLHSFLNSNILPVGYFFVADFAFFFAGF
jgi:hypothetical protein